MTNCTIRGCRKLEKRCTECGRTIWTWDVPSPWINVKDRLPEFGSQVLIYIPEFSGQKDFIAVTLYIHLDCFQGATHWMPLPPPAEPPNE